MSIKSPPKIPPRKRTPIWRWIFGKKPPKTPRKTESLLKKLKRFTLGSILQSEETQNLFTVANERLANLRKLGYYTQAEDDFVQSRKHQWFGEFDKKRVTKFEAYSELYAARRFLADVTSTPEGHLAYEAQESVKEFREAIGTKFIPIYGTRYDQTIISQEVAKTSYAIYRMMEEANPQLIYGKGAFGSENTIAIIMEQVNDSGIDLRVTTEREMTETREEILQRVEDYLQSRIVLLSPEMEFDYKMEFRKASYIVNSFRKGGK